MELVVEVVPARISEVERLSESEVSVKSFGAPRSGRGRAGAADRRAQRSIVNGDGGGFAGERRERGPGMRLYRGWGACIMG
uniref:Uncharacterized protein n=1 Tax=Arundo donax TaxID=35708 RepID=A0A0A9ASU2_ARUDO